MYHAVLLSPSILRPALPLSLRLMRFVQGPTTAGVVDLHKYFFSLTGEVDVSVACHHSPLHAFTALMMHCLSSSLCQ